MDEVFKSLLALGPGGVVAGLMFYLWKEERAERRELSVKVIQITTDAIEAERDMTNGFMALASKLKVAS